MESKPSPRISFRDQFRTPVALILAAIIGVLLITMITVVDFYQYEIVKISNLRWFMRLDGDIAYGESWTEKAKCEAARRELLKEAEDSYLKHYDLYFRKPCPPGDMRICMQGVSESADDVDRLRKVYCAQRDF